MKFRWRIRQRAVSPHNHLMNYPWPVLHDGSYTAQAEEVRTLQYYQPATMVRHKYTPANWVDVPEEYSHARF